MSFGTCGFESHPPHSSLVTSPPKDGMRVLRRRKPRRPPDELAELARTPTWMYEWDLGGGVRTELLSTELPSVHEARATIMREVVESTLAAVGPDASGLDLACSEGGFSHRLLEWGAGRVLGIDVRAENIRRAELIRDYFGIDPQRLSFQVRDVFDLDHLETFDVVLCLGLIYHLENPVGALRVARQHTRRVCVIESQLVEPGPPLVHGWGGAGGFMQQEAAWASWHEPPDMQADNPIAAHGGVMSFVPNRPALIQACLGAGFSRVEPLPAPPTVNQQYVDGSRLVVAAWP